jgi:hypothetical protein
MPGVRVFFEREGCKAPYFWLSRQQAGLDFRKFAFRRVAVSIDNHASLRL